MTSQQWQAWATAQAVTCWLGLLTAVGLGLLGGALIVSDLADDSDMWHGLGVAIGLAACLVALFLTALFESVRRLTRRGVDLARRGDPALLRTSALVALSGLGTAAFGVLSLVGSVGLTSVVLLAAAALLAAPPVGILLTAPERDHPGPGEL